MSEQTGKTRIGLALSGGGFRASLFHLGVIRRLEELGIMKDVEVISTVSGGSILGAYYLVQFEKEQRADKEKSRLEICDIVIEKFYKAIAENMRMRAMVFAPFYHTLAFGTFLLSRGKRQTRTDRMATEFSNHFFSPNLKIGDLPLKPKLLINAASNVEGKRVVFTKRDLSRLSSQTAGADNSQLPLEKAVGASAAVPGLFPPVAIAGDMCSDGGVVDNQGLESLFDYFGLTDKALNRLDKSDMMPRQAGDEIVIICSDASGQIKVEDVPKHSAVASAARSMDILQAGNRTKNIKLLEALKGRVDEQGNPDGIHEFAFFHLSSNVKDWQNEKVGDVTYNKIHQRLCSEFIQPVARLRTDLDEFDLLETFSLMYHGYTLVNWHIASYCPSLKTPYELGQKIDQFDDPSRWGVQFLAHDNLTGAAQDKDRMSPDEKRKFIVERLDVGRIQFFRNVRKEPKVFAPLLFLALLPLLLLMTPVLEPGWVPDAVYEVVPKEHMPEKYVFYHKDAGTLNPGRALAISSMDVLRTAVPFDLDRFFDLDEGRWGNMPVFFSDVLVFGISAYLALFFYWRINRGLVRKMYREDYKKVSPPKSKVPFS